MIETIGEKIKRLRKEMNLTQENIHHNQAQVSLIEKGKISNPDETTLRIIAKGLDTTLDNLIEETDWVKPEDRFLGKEIAVSPNDLNVEVDNKGNIEWTYKVYPLYNEKNERNEYCPTFGNKLIYKCNKCQRQIEDGSHIHCLGCGKKLLPEFYLSRNLSDIMQPGSWVDYHESLNTAADISHEIDKYEKGLYQFNEQIGDLSSSDKKTQQRVRFEIQIFKAVRRKLRLVSETLDKNSFNEPKTISEEWQLANLQLFQEMQMQMSSYLSYIGGQRLLGKRKKEDDIELLKNVMKIMKMAQSGDENNEVISKVQEIIDEGDKARVNFEEDDIENNSEDGNSETAAAKNAEPEKQNAKKEKKKGNK